MLKTSFRKIAGIPSLGILFFWKLTLGADAHGPILDRFIPELFYDFFYIQQGRVECRGPLHEGSTPLASQSLKTLHTQPLTLCFTAPLVLFGVRFSLQFAESFWDLDLPSDQFLAQSWVEPGTDQLPSFAQQVTRTMHKRRVKRVAGPLLSPALRETEWLTRFSPRHKRRLYKTIFGVSRKEIGAIQGLHAFLGQACDFSSRSPRIIEYIDDTVFYDQPHLNHKFTRMTGLTPLEYLQASSILQDNLMAASYNEIAAQLSTIGP